MKTKIKSVTSKDGKILSLLKRHPVFFSKGFIAFLSFSMLSISVLAWWTVYQFNARENQIRVESDTNEVMLKLQNQFEHIRSTLYALRAYYNYQDPLDVDRGFIDFLNGSKVFQDVKGIQVFAYTSLVDSPAKHQKILNYQRNVALRKNFKFWSDSSPLLTHPKSAVTHVYPIDWRNETVIGYDMVSDKPRREAMLAAAKVNDVIATQPVVLKQEVDPASNQMGMLFYLPHYLASPGSPPKISGYFYAAIRGIDFFSSSLKDSVGGRFETLDYEVLVGNFNTGFSSFYTQQKGNVYQGKQLDAKKISDVNKFQLMGKTYIIRSSEGINRLSLIETYAPEVVLALGCVLTIMVTFLATVFQNQVKREAQLVDLALEAADQAQEASQAKSAFLANMSHEIRTPLGAIMGYSEMLADSKITPDRKSEIVMDIKRNGTLLSKLLEDILDSSKIEAGKLSLDPRPVPFEQIISQVTSIMHLKAQLKGIGFHVKKLNPVPPTIITDEHRVVQILTNLINNAIRFTDHGSVTLSYGRSESGTRSVLFFEIRDTGPGIPPAFRDQIFAPFGQADISTTRKYGGTGLGLSLSKRLANLLNGDVMLTESQAGMGSVFRAEIELIEGAGQPIKISQEQKSPSELEAVFNFKGRRILLVEDSQDNQDIFKYFLEQTGAVIDIASDGAEGMRKATTKNYDLILMDVQIPFKDGRQVTRELRAIGIKTPIIALTAHAQVEEVKLCISAGCNAHVAKPVERVVLLAAINNQLSPITKDLSPNP